MGRVLNRFSKDVQSMDRDLADNLMYLISDIVSALAILVIIVAVLPIGFLVAAIAASLIYVLIGSIYLASTREIKRSESTTRSPVISLCTECKSYLTVIAAKSGSDLSAIRHRFARRYIYSRIWRYRPLYATHVQAHR